MTPSDLDRGARHPLVAGVLVRTFAVLAYNQFWMDSGTTVVGAVGRHLTRSFRVWDAEPVTDQQYERP